VVWGKYESEVEEKDESIKRYFSELVSNKKNDMLKID
jgi:hypothetical protein